MKKISLLPLFFLLFTDAALSQQKVFSDSLTINSGINTLWWTGVINDGNKMPLKQNYQADLKSNYGNQAQPLILSNTGEVIWSDNPYRISYSSGKLSLTGKSVKFQYHKAGETLKDAYQYASRTYFPPSGKMPDKLLFTSPQYNTWIELVYNQNQKDIMKYAKSILANGFPAGVLMIDDNWQEDYGKLNFHPGRFPNPRQMIDSLHRMGFKVMVWICPFISPDCDVYRSLARSKYLVTDKTGKPAIVRWWNGASGLLDLTNPKAADWFKSQLNILTNDYGVDGFKLDAGDFEFYENINSFKPDATPQEHSELYGKIGLDYPLNEYRAMWKMGGQPLVERLRDKSHGFEDLQFLIPNMLSAGLMGYYFSCPDLIGGGEFTSFQNLEKMDQESIVRSAQVHALMPMMQFSVAPWRVLDKEHFEAVKTAVKIREKYIAYILELAKKASETGEPIVKPLEYNYPGKGYATITDQFLLGDKLLVAPVLIKGATSRKIIIPEGKWKSFDGTEIKGPKTIEVPVKLNDLPYYEKIK
ncbi:MAG: glycoside hydrolase [Bacteroidales bacterium]|nr:glycoside hydrolase [Bacteroidales bacterium]